MFRAAGSFSNNDASAGLERQIAQALGLDSEGRRFYAFNPSYQSKPLTRAHINFIDPSPVRSVLAGSRGGRAFEDFINDSGIKISRVSVRSGSRVDAIQVT